MIEMGVSEEHVADATHLLRGQFSQAGAAIDEDVVIDQ